MITTAYHLHYASNIRLRESKFFGNLGGRDTRFEGGTDRA